MASIQELRIRMGHATRDLARFSLENLEHAVEFAGAMLAFTGVAMVGVSTVIRERRRKANA